MRGSKVNIAVAVLEHVVEDAGEIHQSLKHTPARRTWSVKKMHQREGRTKYEKDTPLRRILSVKRYTSENKNMSVKKKSEHRFLHVDISLNISVGMFTYSYQGSINATYLQSCSIEAERKEIRWSIKNHSGKRD